MCVCISHINITNPYLIESYYSLYVLTPWR